MLFRSLQLQGSPVQMAGYSGGGLSTAAAAAMAPSYAPELNIIGVAQGGVPMNLLKMAYLVGADRPHPAFGLAMAAAIGFGREYPEKMPVSESLTPYGTELMNRIANSCTNELLSVGANHSALELTNNNSVFDDPEARKVVLENSVELYPGVPNAPMFEWHSPYDGLIPVDAIDSSTRRYCDAGVKVNTVLIPTQDHLTAAVIGLPQALAWMQDRFDGKPAPSTC